MTGSDFAQYVKAKLNRLDSDSWEDVRNEEIYLYGLDALKKLSLRFDAGIAYPQLDKRVLNNYLAQITKKEVIALSNNLVTIPTLLRIKDLAVLVVIGSETAYQPTREADTEDQTIDTYSPFAKSYPDMPRYILSAGKIEFLVDGFLCSSIKITYLEHPVEITEGTNFEFPFMTELQDETVSLILENLESGRIQTQPSFSKQ
jgi:hypothetical protein